MGGAGLADGYHGRDSLTRDRFVEMAFDGDRAVRLYRTGDLVRASASGAIRWLARLDNQVKLRGFRIELGRRRGRVGRAAGRAPGGGHGRTPR
nr:AMP-binding protein [Burkholderia glumae]